MARQSKKMRCSLGLHHWSLLPSGARACTRCGKTEMMFYDTWEVVTPREAYGALKVQTASVSHLATDDTSQDSTFAKTAAIKQTN